MIRLMHPDTGNIITVTKRQEPFYRRAGWVDPPAASSRSASKRTTAAAGASSTKPAQHTTATQEKPTA